MILICQTFWAGVSVGGFFKGYNWRGTPPQLESPASNNRWQKSSWLNSTVEEFLSCSNWRGQPLSQEPSQGTQLPSLTQSVQAYFGHFSWRGNSTLGMVQPLSSVSESDNKELSISASPEFKLTDLSDLF